MSDKLNKLLACCKVFLYGIFILLFSQTTNAQDTIGLKEINVTAKRTEYSQIGKKIIEIDSVTKEKFGYNSVSDLISLNSGVFVKNYGPGNIATTSFRGGNASQTAILWNGFNLQNAMLGQTDLSMLPSFLFENIIIEHGGSSSAWGTGSVGGSIHLNNKLQFNKGLQLKQNIGVSSFGTFNPSTLFVVSKKRFISSTKVFLKTSKNNYTYRDSSDTLDQIKRMEHSSYSNYGLMQDLKFLLSENKLLNLNFWYNSFNREVPSYGLSKSKQYQYDENIRIALSYSLNKGKVSSNFKTAFFSDKLNYNDSTIKLYSKSRVETAIAENENIINWARNQQGILSCNFTFNNAISENYAVNRSVLKTSVNLGNRAFLMDKKIVFFGNIRAEYFNAGIIPITSSFGSDFNILKNWHLKFSAAKVYRQPTLNELYWQPGGNPELKPEQGITCDGELNYTKQLSDINIFMSGSIFNRNMNNWILWIPGASGNPTPINIQNVWSRGSESSIKLSYIKGNYGLILNLNSTYVLSTVQSNDLENSSNINKQLIYTPRYNYNGQLTIKIKKLSILYLHQYIGYRFTSSDNYNWLPPYHYSSVRANYNASFKKQDITFYAACNNIFNINYSLIQNRPMPLRNYELGISIMFNNKSI